jgi:Short repeat of unknown function (DUF308)
LMLGIAILVLPLAGVASLALLVAAFLFAGGITRTALAFRFKPRRGWGWVLFDGLLSIGLAILIAIGWPQTSLAFVGLLTGFTRSRRGFGGSCSGEARQLDRSRQRDRGRQPLRGYYRGGFRFQHKRRNAPRVARRRHRVIGAREIT